MRENIIKLLTECFGKTFYRPIIEGVADHLIANGVTINRWIPVGERLPKKEGLYLIFTTIHFIPDHVDDCNHYDGIDICAYHPEWGFMGAHGLYAKAWMPLPDVPKED